MESNMKRSVFCLVIACLLVSCASTPIRHVVIVGAGGATIETPVKRDGSFRKIVKSAGSEQSMSGTLIETSNGRFLLNINYIHHLKSGGIQQVNTKVMISRNTDLTLAWSDERMIIARIREGKSSNNRMNADQ